MSMRSKVLGDATDLDPADSSDTGPGALDDRPVVLAGSDGSSDDGPGPQAGDGGGPPDNSDGRPRGSDGPGGGPSDNSDGAADSDEIRDMMVADGWRYFIHGWTQVIGEVFDVAMPAATVEELATLAEPARSASASRSATIGGPHDGLE